MKKASPILAILLTFVILIGILTPAFADEDTASEGTSAENVTVETVLTSLFTGETIQEVTESTSESTTEAQTKGFSFTPVRDYVYHRGLPTLTTKTFGKIFYALRVTNYILTGKILYQDPNDTLDVTMDDNLKYVCDEIASKSALDPYAILTNLPDVFEPAIIIDKVFEIDVTAFRAEMYKLVEEYKEQDEDFKANVCWFIGAYMSGITKAEFTVIPTEEENVGKLKLVITYLDGETETFYPGIYFDMETGRCYGHDEKGMVTIGFDSNFLTCVVSAPINCWMKKFGFCVEYDILCYLLPVYCYNTRRFHFDYNNKEYMIQIWKGNYLITNGGEVGIYYRDPGSVGTFYDVVDTDDQLVMSLKIYHEDELLVDIPEQSHWWVNGFKMGDRMYSPHSLSMYFTIEMADEEMLKAFTAAVDSNYHHDVSYTVDGLKVSLAWLD